MQKSPCERNRVKSAQTGFVSTYETGSDCACVKQPASLAPNSTEALSTSVEQSLLSSDQWELAHSWMSYTGFTAMVSLKYTLKTLYTLMRQVELVGTQGEVIYTNI